MKLDLGRRAVCAIAGSSVASARPVSATSAIPGRICLLPCVPPPDRALRWCCRNCRPRPCSCSSFAAKLAPDEHAALVADQAGWHIAEALRLPDNVTLIYLPPYSPELIPVERL